ncbi:MAG: ADP-ribosylglycohydrolase family protein [Gemmatimonadota bacterium]
MMTPERSSRTLLSDRIAGSFLGLAVCDALGTTLEFRRPGSFEPIHDMVGGGPFALQPGEWTDDTSMALCLAESLIEREGLDPADQMDRYLRWRDEGECSPTGECFDVGATVGAALERYRRYGDPIAGDPSPRLAGNGGLMRLAPAVLYFHDDEALALEAAWVSTACTHRAPQALSGSDLFARMLLAALRGEEREAILAAGKDERFAHAVDEPRDGRYHSEIAAIARGEGIRDPFDYSGGGYVVDTLQVVLRAFAATDSFREGALATVNAGGDADTNGAVFGQLAGAYYGLGAIPTEWLERLAWKDRLLGVARRLEGRGGVVAE